MCFTNGSFFRLYSYKDTSQFEPNNHGDCGNDMLGTEVSPCEEDGLPESLKEVGTIPVCILLCYRLQETSSRFMNDFIIERSIGKGGYGTVFLCRHRWDGMQYAVGGYT